MSITETLLDFAFSELLTSFKGRIYNLSATTIIK